VDLQHTFLKTFISSFISSSSSWKGKKKCQKIYQNEYAVFFDVHLFVPTLMYKRSKQVLLTLKCGKVNKAIALNNNNSNYIDTSNNLQRSTNGNTYFSNVHDLDGCQLPSPLVTTLFISKYP